MRAHRVRALLMGGQACVFYGAAEFSRDTDFAILADAANLARLRRALADLQATVIAVPPLVLKYLRRGHAVFFRCGHPDARRLRVDVMSRMRGVAAFASLWRRRTTIRLPDGLPCDLLALPDLVQAKKTQRDKDWPMIRRLLEADYFRNRHQARPAQIRFWFRELRTPELLLELARRRPAVCRSLIPRRPLLAHALAGDADQLEAALAAEQAAERQRDQEYWRPLRRELEALRRHRRRAVTQPPTYNRELFEPHTGSGVKQERTGRTETPGLGPLRVNLGDPLGRGTATAVARGRTLVPPVRSVKRNSGCELRLGVRGCRARFGSAGALGRLAAQGRESAAAAPFVFP